MRFRVAFVALLLSSAAAAQVPLGERLGADISRAERDYFGLFPAVAGGFESAVLEPQPDRVNVVVRRTGAPDTTLVLERGAAEALGRYVATFEQAPEARLNTSWQEASGSARTPRLDATAAVPFVDVRHGVAHVTVGGRRYAGVVLAASDTALVLHAAGEPYDWQRPRVVRLAAAGITGGRRDPAGLERFSWASTVIGGALGLFVAGANTFALDGGADSVPLFAGAAVLGSVVVEQFWPRPPAPGSYADRLPDLRRQAAFRLQVPLDFPRLVTGEAAAFSSEALLPPAPAPAVRRLARWRRDHGWVNVAVLGGPAGGFPLDQTYTEFFRNQTPSVQTSPVLTNTSDLEVAVDVAVRPLPWVRAGATYTRLRRGPVPDVTDAEVATAAPGALRGYAELVAPTPRVAGFGLEVALGVGVERTTVEVRGQPFRGNDRTVEYALARSGTNRFLQATAELVMPRRTSLFVRLTTRTVAPVAVAGAEVTSVQFPSIVLYRLDAHEVAFGEVREVSWGTRFRF